LLQAFLRKKKETKEHDFVIEIALMDVKTHCYFKMYEIDNIFSLYNSVA